MSIMDEPLDRAQREAVLNQALRQRTLGQQQTHTFLTSDLLAAAAAADIKVTVNQPSFKTAPQPQPGVLLRMLLAAKSLRKL